MGREDGGTGEMGLGERMGGYNDSLITFHLKSIFPVSEPKANRSTLSPLMVIIIPKPQTIRYSSHKPNSILPLTHSHPALISSHTSISSLTLPQPHHQ